MSTESIQSQGTHEPTEATTPRDEMRDTELSAQKTERWFFYPKQHEHPEYAYERRCQDRSLAEFS